MVSLVSLGSLEISPYFSRMHSHKLSKRTVVCGYQELSVHAVADQLITRTPTLELALDISTLMISAKFIKNKIITVR